MRGKKGRVESQESLRLLMKRQREFLRKFDVQFENDVRREERENSRERHLTATK